MTLILFCRSCNDSVKCDGKIDCPWLNFHDEANCSQQCPSRYSIPCDCNKAGNMTCEGKGTVCYNKPGKYLTFFIFVNVSITSKKIKQRRICFKKLLIMT